jgi:predicted amidohydrolase
MSRVLSMACYAAEAQDQKAANLAMVLECLDLAVPYRPDFVCFPEIVLQQRMKFPQAIEAAEPVSGPAAQAVAGRARAMGCHVLLPMVEGSGGEAYNAVVLIGRSGEVVGVYHKFHATDYEMADGIMPGDDVPVWPTDRGRVGVAVCFDLKFPEVGLRLSRGRANVCFWPSMFPGGSRLRAWAMDYGMYMVKCTGGAAEVIDPAGERAAVEGPVFPLRQSGATLRVAWPEIMARYAGGVEVTRNQPEGTFTLASRMEDRTVEDIEREFDLIDLRAYLDRAADARRARLEARRQGRGPLQ